VVVPCAQESIQFVFVSIASLEMGRGRNHDPDFDDRMLEYSDEDSDDEPVQKVRYGHEQ
jgi:hypothetical protein